MSTTAQRWTIIALVALHVLLVAAYTLPQQFVPTRLGAWAQVLVRPLFHQEWHLFSPDPPICSCELEVAMNGRHIAPLVPNDASYLRKRMARHLADHVQDGITNGSTTPAPILQEAIRSMARDIARDSDGLTYRLVEQCATDPVRPGIREERITTLTFTSP
ncbi:MAG: hypothetical protein R2818_15765 [Flavobacteriales bacterium]